MKAIINMTTAFLLLLMFLFGWSLITYNENPEKYQWLDANGEFKTSSYDITVSYNLDTPLDELNGNSLNEVFEDQNSVLNGHFTENLYNWALVGGSGWFNYVSVQDGYVSITGTNNGNQRIQQTFTSSMNDIWYYAYDAKLYSGDGDYITFYNGTSFNRQDLTNDWTTITGISNATTSSPIYFQFGILVNTGTIFVDNVYALNLTALGINQTKDEMDYWYSEYQKLQHNQIENYKELGSTVESSWQYLTGYFTTLVDILDAQVQVILNPFEALADGLSIITVPIFG